MSARSPEGRVPRCMRPGSPSRWMLGLLTAALCAGTLLGLGRPAAAADTLASLELDYLSNVRRTDEPGYAAQAEALTKIADLRTEQARKKLLALLETHGAKYPRRAVLILRALVRNGRPQDLDRALRWVEAQRNHALKALVHEIVCAPTVERTRAHLRGDLLERSPLWLKVQIVRGLGELGDAQAVAPLLQLLREPDMRLRIETMEALGRLKAKRALPLIQVFLRDQAYEMRDGAARALGLLGDPRALPALQRTLEDPDPLVVESAAISLGCLGVPTVVPDLIAGLEKNAETNLRLVDAFTEALQRISGKAITADAELWRSWWQTVKDKPWMRAAEPLDGLTVEGPSYYGFPVRSSRVVFVLDVSRSMGWNDRLKSAKAEIVKVLGKLPRSSRFGLIVFSDNATAWRGEALKEAKPRTVRDAITHVKGLKPRNGTNTYGALMRAFNAPRADTFFFLSDGHPSMGIEQDPKVILNLVREKNRYRRVRIHAVALIRGAAPAAYSSLENPERSLSFMQALAKQNAGRFKAIR